MRHTLVVCLMGPVLVFAAAAKSRAAAPVPPPAQDEWKAQAVREEIRPRFERLATGGRSGGECLLIAGDGRPGLDGYWVRSFPVQGGKYFRFQAYRQSQNLPSPRRNALVRIGWLDANNKMVQHDQPMTTPLVEGQKVRAEEEHPQDGTTDASGWTEVSGVYRVPSKATQGVVELHLQWAPRGIIRWSDVTLSEVAAPPPRIVRLAAVHYVPKGRSPQENCRQFAPLIAEAGRQHADLVVLGETLTNVNLPRNPGPELAAEPIPGPSTNYFGQLARKHNLYIVAGLLERAAPLVYNVAILIGPDGKVQGKYRKVTLPRAEVASGVAPGDDYPVFQTRFGKVGMMICYDGFFPEPARELSKRGAEVIAWPVWGCNPLLARARAAENHVYLVSSTYCDPKRNWMLTAIFDHAGRTMAVGDQWGTVVVAQVDLGQPTLWSNLGDFRAMIPRHRPPVSADP